MHVSWLTRVALIATALTLLHANTKVFYDPQSAVDCVGKMTATYENFNCASSPCASNLDSIELQCIIQSGQYPDEPYFTLDCCSSTSCSTQHEVQRIREGVCYDNSRKGYYNASLDAFVVEYYGNVLCTGGVTSSLQYDRDTCKNNYMFTGRTPAIPTPSPAKAPSTSGCTNCFQSSIVLFPVVVLVLFLTLKAEG